MKRSPHDGRTLLGWDVYALPVGGLGQGHLEAAWDVLRSFDIVIRAENEEDYAQVSSSGFSPTGGRCHPGMMAGTSPWKHLRGGGEGATPARMRGRLPKGGLRTSNLEPSMGFETYRRVPYSNPWGAVPYNMRGALGGEVARGCSGELGVSTAKLGSRSSTRQTYLRPRSARLRSARLFVVPARPLEDTGGFLP